MNVIYVVVAHQCPHQVSRLIRGLRSANSHFYLQVDCSEDDFPKWQSVIGQDERIHLKRVFEVKWGGVEFVKVVLDAATLAARDHKQGCVVLLSGQDYPIKPRVWIEDFLTRHRYVTFMECEPYPVKFWFDGGRSRWFDYTLFNSARRKDYLAVPPLLSGAFGFREHAVPMVRKFGFWGAIRKLKAIMMPRRWPKDLRLAGGSAWWIMPLDNLRFICEKVRTNPRLLSRYSFSLLPDELFFHTCFQTFRNDLPHKELRSSLTWVDWSVCDQGSPKDLDEGDLDGMRHLPHLFARKMHFDKSAKLMDAIDALMTSYPESLADADSWIIGGS